MSSFAILPTRYLARAVLRVQRRTRALLTALGRKPEVSQRIRLETTSEADAGRAPPHDGLHVNAFARREGVEENTGRHKGASGCVPDRGQSRILRSRLSLRLERGRLLVRRTMSFWAYRVDVAPT